MEKELLEANEKMVEMTKGNQKFRYDLREDGKMDISFVRFDKQYEGNYGMNYPDAYLTKLGFNSGGLFTLSKLNLTITSKDDSLSKDTLYKEVINFKKIN